MAPPDAIEKSGVVDVLVNATVVVAVVPKSVTPESNENDWFATAEVTVGDAASVALEAATSSASLPPPHPARVPATASVNARLRSLFMGWTFR